MNCSGHGDAHFLPPLHCYSPKLRKPTAALSPGAIQSASFICLRLSPRGSIFDTLSCSAAPVIRINSGRWLNVCVVAGSARLSRPLRV